MASLNPYTGNLGIKNAAHLLRRAAFGATKQQIDQYAGMTAAQTLDDLFQDVPVPEPPIDPLTGETWLNPKPDPEINSKNHLLLKYYMAWHFEQMRKSNISIKERIVYFYHTHLPVQYSIVRSSTEIYYQNVLYRYYAFGNFKTMFTKLTTDNAMLRYIDNHLNEAGSPNENYAREMMELYTIGKGPQIASGDYTNYTEEDIQQVARVISGIKNDSEFTNLDPDTGIPGAIVRTNSEEQAYLHDSGVKTFSDKFQNTEIQPNELIGAYATEDAVYQELDDLMTMIFSQEETAKFLCRKIYRQFVYYDITEEIETDIITPLAETFRTNDFNIEPVLRQLLRSEHFFDADNSVTTDDHVGAIIKSPVELITGILKFFDIELPESDPDFYDNTYLGGLLNILDDQGMRFYEPIDVAGYPAYHQTPTYNRHWITATNLANRYLFGRQVVENDNLGFNLDIVDYVDNNISDPGDPDVIVQEIVDYMLPVDITPERFNYFKSFLTDKLSDKHWKEEWNNFKKGVNDDKATRVQLENFIIAIMQSPEYQLC
ncbi:MAG: DUF1800 domain-containing protein [Bacteroidota bacterium]|nr:DUF1800 domain-containing protein [Bacteroidota bacterium]